MGTGSVYAVTDSTGNIVNGGGLSGSQRYWGYGRIRESGSGAFATEYQFQGQRQDGTGLQYFNASVRPSLLETVLGRGKSSE